MLCGASGFLTQGPQRWLHPEHCGGCDKTWPQNHTEHQHMLTQGAESSSLQQHYPSLSPHVLRYLLSEPAGWYYQWEPQSSCSTSWSHGTIPALRSSLPIPRCARGAVSPSHFLVGAWRSPLMLISCTGDTQLLLLHLEMLLKHQKCSLQAWSLFPPLCSTLYIYCFIYIFYILL